MSRLQNCAEIAWSSRRTIGCPTAIREPLQPNASPRPWRGCTAYERDCWHYFCSLSPPTLINADDAAPNTHPWPCIQYGSHERSRSAEMINALAFVLAGGRGEERPGGPLDLATDVLVSAGCVINAVRASCRSERACAPPSHRAGFPRPRI